MSYPCILKLSNPSGLNIKILCIADDTSEESLIEMRDEITKIIENKSSLNDFGKPCGAPVSVDYELLQHDTPADEKVRIICAERGVNDMYVNVLKFYCRGLKYKEIGSHLSLSEETVKSYLKESRAFFDNISQNEMKKILMGGLN